MMTMAREDAQATIRDLNELVAKFSASSSDLMKEKHAKAIDKLEDILFRGNRKWTGGRIDEGTMIPSCRKYEAYVLVLLDEEKAEDHKLVSVYRDREMRNDLDRAILEYRQKLKSTIEDCTRELANIDDGRPLSESTYRYSGAMDLAILNERIIRLQQLVRCMERGEYGRW